MGLQIAHIKVNENVATLINKKTITSGLVGGTVLIEYDEGWAELNKQVVFRTQYRTMNADGCALPPEITKYEYSELEVGVYGFDPDGAVVIPTIWVSLGKIMPGADPSGDESVDPSLPVWARHEKRICDLEKGGVTGGYYTPAVSQPDADTMRVEYIPSAETMPAVPAVNMVLPAGPRGIPGDAGPRGPAGNDGITPHIGENGNWWIGDVDTGVKASPDSSQNATLSDAEKTLILTLFRNSVYTSDVSVILAQLENLWGNSDEGGGDSGGTDAPTFYIVTNKLTNVSNSNPAASVASGGSYTATLTVADGCDMESVKVAMGGSDITEWAYSGGVVTIASVTGNVVITAVARPASDITQDGDTLIIVAVPNVAQNGTALIIE